MDPFEMVVAIIIVVTIGKVLQARFRASERRSEDPTENIDALRMRDEIRTLKERIAVLERVITDNNRSIELDREIERLRDNNRV
ncbi:hypothetical protein [Sphingosinithalassobacter sp. CS137]|uniref:hypothetical protein n=1 Tax=Sphingosinithalassobacter sp. CS137 TaxID=2762748 RepID=UPI00165D6AA0|nr:hypothetical protein [Sphingosinithalassobacter sp. CS137]